MYRTQGVLKNVNLRTELAGDERVGAFDLKVEAMLTSELHDTLCGGDSQGIGVKQLKNLGITEVKYGSDIDNVVLTVGKLVVKEAKLNKVIGKIGSDQKVLFRLQAHIHQRGLVEDLNAITHEPSEIKIEMMQGDMLNDAGDEKEASAPKSASKKRTSKKKAAKKETATTPGEAEEKPSSMHVNGDAGEKLTPEQIAEREEEKRRILAAQKDRKNKSQDENALRGQIDEIFVELNDAKMGQGDEHEFRQLKEKHNAGKRLTDPQIEKLLDIHHVYSRAA